jgi:tRNA-2-methylthio-N6-dimethylallyladenosine synthase
MKRKLYLETFGCQMNVLDSELVMGQLRARGFESTEDRDNADVVIFNTCSVREHAEQKVWSRLGQLRETKQTNPNLVIGVIGCMAERDGSDIFKRFPHIDILCGPGELDKLPGMVVNASTSRMVDAADASISPAQRTQERTDQRHVALMGATSRRSSTLAAAEDNLELLDLSRALSPGDDVSQAYVRITRGCNKFCTYCVVPYTRGPEVHRPPQNIIDEVKMIADAGALEVTLLGQTINHYAFTHGDGRVTTFADLLYLIHEAVPHLPRLRFVTSYPRDFTDAALQAMRDCERICRYLHVPAQHGNNRILKAMNRGYTIEEYDDFVGRAKALMPDICLASDFIVGFPTETEEEFRETIDVVKRHRFKNSFIFKYSPRPGTIAIKRFEDDVPEEVKKRRNNELLAVQSEICEQTNIEMVGKTVDVIVEGESKLVSKQAAYPSSNVTLGAGFQNGRSRFSDSESEPRTQLIGRTRGDQIVVFDGPPTLKGKIRSVEIIRSSRMTLFAQLADQPVTV